MTSSIETRAAPPVPEKPHLTLGFIPLTDCASLVVAKEKGYFEKYGLDVKLSRETSWANIRDKVAIGLLDGAQMPAPMPIAMSMGIGPLHKPMVTSMVLDLNGNAITVSKALYRRMKELAPEMMNRRPLGAEALKRVIEANAAAALPPLTFAMVFPVSTHNYELRYWMASAGIDPDRDIDLVVIPPPQMVGALSRGEIDGYCVGEPWNQQAVQEDIGCTLITSYELWNNRPEKVLGVTRSWAEQYPHTHQALVMALLEASRWMDEAGNRREVVAMIADPRYVDIPAHVLRMPMTGMFQYRADELPVSMKDFNVFHRYAANYPWRSHAMWFITQMLRWGQAEHGLDEEQIKRVAEDVYRPQIHRNAAAALGIACPQADAKLEGIHGGPWQTQDEAGNPLEMGSDLFFDGKVFDPGQALDYLNGFRVRADAAVPTSAKRTAGPLGEAAHQPSAADRLP